MSPNGIIPAAEAERSIELFLKEKKKQQRLTNVVIWGKRRDYGYTIRNRAKVDHINLIHRLCQRKENNTEASLRT